MKSRFEVLTSTADRRKLALFRSSGAAGVVLTLLAISSLSTSPHGTREIIRGDLFATEIGDFATLRNVSELDPTPSAARRSAGTEITVANEEFAFPANYIGESVGY